MLSLAQSQLEEQRKHASLFCTTAIAVWMTWFDLTGKMEAVLILFCHFGYRMMWAAGAVAAMSSITFPAVSALVSRTADADQQGELIGTQSSLLTLLPVVKQILRS